MENKRCLQCGAINASSFRFCKRCGTELPAIVTPASSPVPPAVSSPPPQRVLEQAEPVGQMGQAGTSNISIWQPFAGYGQRGRHVSWLLSNLGERAEALRAAVTERFVQRQIADARVETRTLTSRGILVERRPYYMVRRGIVTVGLYIARFGQDLYISQVTYAKGAINPLRVLVLGLMVAFQIGYVVLAVVSMASAQLSELSKELLGSQSSQTLETLQMLVASLCCLGPLWTLNALALSLAAVYMVYRFITDRDPLALLRTPPNEFQQDDIIALEKAVEETVRQSLDKVGIDAALMPPAPEYGFRRRLI